MAARAAGVAAASAGVRLVSRSGMAVAARAGAASSVAAPRHAAAAAAAAVASASARRGMAEAATGDQLMFRLSLPHKTVIAQTEVAGITVPGVSGDFGVNAEHVPVVAELGPGVVRVQAKGAAEGDSSDYFINGGFCVVHGDNSCDVTAIEAVPVEDIDPEAAKDQFRKFTADLAAARDEEATTEAEIGIEVSQALCDAVGVAP